MQPNFDDLEEISFRKASKTDWVDTNLLNKKGINVFWLEDSDVVILGDAVFKSIQTGCSEQMVGTILLLAWNLRSTGGGTAIFPPNGPCASQDNISYRNLPDITNQSWGFLFNSMESASFHQKVRAYPYISCSLLRLFTKSVNNFSGAWQQVMEGYKNFYRHDFPFPGYTFQNAAITYIHLMFAQKELFKNTLANFLYVHDDCAADQGLRRYLYEQHLEYTGMHCYNLLLKALGRTQVKTSELLAVLLHRTTKHALCELAIIIRDFVVQPNPSRRRGTWRFARIFNSLYFVEVQTKNCPMLVSVLAHLSIMIGAQSETAGNVLNITHLQTLSNELKSYHNKVACRIYNLFYDSADTSTSSCAQTQEAQLSDPIYGGNIPGLTCTVLKTNPVEVQYRRRGEVVSVTIPDYLASVPDIV